MTTVEEIRKKKGLPKVEPKQKRTPEEIALAQKEGQAFIQQREKRANVLSGGAPAPSRRAREQAIRDVEERGQLAPEQRTVEDVQQEKAALGKRFEEEGVFKEVKQVPIISPEQENLKVMWRIAKRSEEHTSELQSHSFISYAVFCLKKKKNEKKKKKTKKIKKKK